MWWYVVRYSSAWWTLLRLGDNDFSRGTLRLWRNGREDGIWADVRLLAVWQVDAAVDVDGREGLNGGLQGRTGICAIGFAQLWGDAVGRSWTSVAEGDA